MPMDFHLDTLLNFPNVTIESCLQQSNEVYLKGSSGSAVETVLGTTKEDLKNS